MPAKNMPGRKAGKDHARSQGPLRGEAFVGSTLSLAAISGSLFLSVQPLSGRDPVQVHHGMTEEALIRAGSLGNHTLSSGHPGMLLARISIFLGAKNTNSCK